MRPLQGETKAVISALWPRLTLRLLGPDPDQGPQERGAVSQTAGVEPTRRETAPAPETT